MIIYNILLHSFLTVSCYIAELSTIRKILKNGQTILLVGKFNYFSIILFFNNLNLNIF